MRALCVSIHDVAPGTLDACRRIADAIARIDSTIPLTLLVVPRYHFDTALSDEFVDWIDKRLECGDELALHGYTHVDDTPAPGARLRRRVYTAGEGEFAVLDAEEARRRIALGRAWFDALGWTCEGFVAPAWLASPGTWEALRTSGFRYTTTLTRFHALGCGKSVRAPSLVYSTRSPWRAHASRVWNAALACASVREPLVRVGFHPADAAHPAVMSQALELVARLARKRTPLTKSAFARRVS